MKLYIIGNGFDLHFGLHTAPKDFYEFLEDKRTHDAWSVVEVLEGYGLNWGEFENSLSELAIDDLADDVIIPPDYMSDHEFDRDGGIVNMDYYLEYLNTAIVESLGEMINVANKSLKEKTLSIEDLLLIDDNSPILNFNYTSTVEHLFNKTSFHIHGFFENQENLVFGYKECLPSRIGQDINSPLEEDHDYYIDEQKKRIIDFYKSLKKDYKINLLNEFIDSLGEVDEIVVLGHSMNSVDDTYFNLIEEKTNPKKWTIYYHDDEVKKNVESYCFKNKTNFICW